MRAPIRTLTFTFLLLAPLSLHGAGTPVCGAADLIFGCTQTEEPGRLRAGCAVHDRKHFFASEWRLYDLQSEEVLKRVQADQEGVALVDLPDRPWVILEGQVVCTTHGREITIPYRFLIERTGKNSYRQSAYTPETLVGTGNWNPDTQIHYGEFRGRSITGSSAAPVPDR